MRKSYLILLALAGLAIPLACSNNNNPTTPAVPSPTPTNWAGYTNTFTPTFTPTATPTSTNPGGITSTPTLTPSATPTSTGATATLTNTLTSTPTATSTSTIPLKANGPSVQYPNGLALGNGNLYVAQGNGTSGNLVRVFNASNLSAAPTTLTGFGSTSFGIPNGVAVNLSTGNVYVVDVANSAVYEFTSGGATVTSWTSWTGGTVTSFLNPEGIAVDGAGHIYIADTGNNTVEEFTTTGSTVNYVNQWSSGTGAFDLPSAVATDASNYLYVANAGNGLVQIYNGSWSSWSAMPNSDLFGIAVDGSGNVYLADAGNSFVEEYNNNGTTLLTEWNGSSSPSRFVSPDGVVLTGSDIWVTDFENGSSNKGTLTEFGP